MYIFATSMNYPRFYIWSRDFIKNEDLLEFIYVLECN